jgi:hypothetical protein
MPFAYVLQCMPKNKYVNADGFNDDRTSYNGTQLVQCPVFLVQGMPWTVVSGILTPGYAWNVSTV